MKILSHNDASDTKKHAVSHGPVKSFHILQVDDSKNMMFEKEEKRSILEKCVFEEASSGEDYELKLCGRKKFRTNETLFTFRIAQFLWYGAGNLPTIFLSTFMTQRGLTLVELSSVFSMIFVFQFLCCSATGILADKIGNAKPVLMFLVLSSCFVLVFMCLTPYVNNESCIERNRILNEFASSEYSSNFSFCYSNCLLNNKTHTIKQDENCSPDPMFGNVSTIQFLDLEINKSQCFCHFSYTPAKNISIYSSSDDCCNACANSTAVDCVSERNIHAVVAYAILILAFFSICNAAFRFMDFTSISLAEKYDSHFGKEMAVAMCGNALFAIVIAIALNVDKSSNSKINYDPVIWICAGLMFCAFLALCATKVPILPPAKNLLKNAFSLLRDLDVLAFILLVFVAGNGFAFTLTFRLVFLETINASSILIGLHSVAIILYAFPLLLTANWWLKKLGSHVVFALSLLFYAVNCIAYSYLFNPWWSLILDISKAVSYDLFWVAVVMHCWNTAPVGFAYTLNAVTGAVHFGVGRSSGVFFGGMLMNYMGPRKAYRIMSVIFFVTAVSYSIFVYIRRRLSPPDANVKADKKTSANISENPGFHEEETKIS